MLRFVTLAIAMIVIVSGVDALASKLDRMADETMGSCEVPGTAVVLLRRGHVALFKGYRFADREAEKPVTAHVLAPLQAAWIDGRRGQAPR